MSKIELDVKRELEVQLFEDMFKMQTASSGGSNKVMLNRCGMFDTSMWPGLMLILLWNVSLNKPSTPNMSIMPIVNSTIHFFVSIIQYCYEKVDSDMYI